MTEFHNEFKVTELHMQMYQMYQRMPLDGCASSLIKHSVVMGVEKDFMHCFILIILSLPMSCVF